MELAARCSGFFGRRRAGAASPRATLLPADASPRPLLHADSTRAYTMAIASDSEYGPIRYAACPSFRHSRRLPLSRPHPRPPTPPLTVPTPQQHRTGHREALQLHREASEGVQARTDRVPVQLRTIVRPARRHLPPSGRLSPLTYAHLPQQEPDLSAERQQQEAVCRPHATSRTAHLQDGPRHRPRIPDPRRPQQGRERPGTQGVPPLPR